MRLKAKVDKSNIDKAWKAIKSGGQKAVDRARTRALKSGASAFTSAKKGGAPAIYTIKAADLKKATTVNKDSIVVRSSRYTIGESPSHFQISPKAYKSQKGVKVSRRKKMSAAIKKGQKKKFPHAFIANPEAIKGGHAMLWERTGKVINPIHSLSAAQMITNPEVEEAVMSAINETYEKRLDHELERMGL
jgi:hypothetical protein